jgi:hypothetical protein
MIKKLLSKPAGKKEIENKTKDAIKNVMKSSSNNSIPDKKN